MTTRPIKWLKDELDRRIIRELQSNARESTSNIATRLGVARSTVHERIARMEKDGVITGYSVVLSKNPSEENIQALVFLEIKQQETKQIIHHIGQYSEIRVCLSISGDFDLFLSVEAPRIEDLDVIVDELGALRGVLKTKTYVVFGRRFDRRYNESVQRITEQILEIEGHS
ncbi:MULTISPECIES: Lrp/AsnC family transcriptional regulator [unclassified Lentilitoribacter]|jgi:DNA-binding Lrp family transcriptional regulator|uniref:Lrp/AsnC family transcriptional regulator n=1 Tax=unclassified Lentilitoribacter TaxID=2647570 RepID=UPI0013A69CA5|nr:Lrp/AsnC family transcriptional regulator [Lentilitoribacter sp. Alg239-R112]